MTNLHSHPEDSQASQKTEDAGDPENATFTRLGSGRKVRARVPGAYV